MNIRKLMLTAALPLAAMALPMTGFATQGGGATTVVAVLTTSEANPDPATGLVYGGCMAYLATPINQFSNSPNCPDRWVSFSCDGTYASKDAALMLLDQAQLAQVAKKQVYVVVNDAKLHNGICTAFRVDLWN